MKLPEPVVHSVRSALCSTGRPPPRPSRRVAHRSSQSSSGNATRGYHTARVSADAARILERAAHAVAQLSRAQLVRTPTLGANFRALLSYCAPIFKGAGNTFLATPPIYARGFQSASLAFSQAASRSGSQIALQAARTARLGSGGIGRTSRIPIVPRSSAYGAGLQSARSFSTGGGSAGFNSVVNNVPLILRALGNEIDGKDKRMGSGVGAKPSPRRMPRSTQAKLARGEIRRVSRSVKAAAAAAIAAQPTKAAAAAEKAASLTTSETDEALAEYFAPAPPMASAVARGPHYGITTTLSVALDPDLRTILCATTDDLRPGNADDPLVTPSFASTLHATRHAYAQHAALLHDLLSVLGREVVVESVRAPHGAPDERARLVLDGILDDEQLLRNLHGQALAVVFDGWTAHDVRTMLDARVGSALGARLAGGNSGACSLRETRTGGHIETYFAFPQLDMSAVHSLPASPAPSHSDDVSYADDLSLPSTPSSTASDLLSLPDFEHDAEMDDDLQDSRFL